MKYVIILFAIVLLSTVGFAKEYVFLTVNGQNIDTVKLELVAGRPYTFYGYGSSGISKTVLYVKWQRLIDEGKTASITFIPPHSGLYELDIIGFSGKAQVASQKIYLNVKESEPPETGSGCQENWVCSAWSECIGGTQTRYCHDENICNTQKNKPPEERSCNIEDDGEDETPHQAACQENWMCTDWSSCSDGFQTRMCTDRNSCGSQDKKPGEFRRCQTNEEKESFISFGDCGFETGKFLDVCSMLQASDKNTRTCIQTIGDKKIAIGFSLSEPDAEKLLAFSSSDPSIIFSNSKIYIFSKNPETRQKIKEITEHIGNQFKNDPCSAFYNFLNLYSKLSEEKPPASEPHMSILIVPVAWKNEKDFTKKSEALKAEIINALALSSCSEKMKITISDNYKYGYAWIKGSCNIKAIQCENKRIFDQPKDRIISVIKLCAEQYEEKTGESYDRVIGLIEDDLDPHSAKCGGEILHGGWTLYYYSAVVGDASSVIHELGHTFGLNEQYCDYEYTAASDKFYDDSEFDLRKFKKSDLSEEALKQECGRFDAINPLKDSLGCGGALDKTCFSGFMSDGSVRVLGNIDRFGKDTNGDGRLDTGERTIMADGSRHFSSEEFRHIEKFVTCSKKFSQNELITKSVADRYSEPL